MKRGVFISSGGSCSFRHPPLQHAHDKNEGKTRGKEGNMEKRKAIGEKNITHVFTMYMENQTKKKPLEERQSRGVAAKHTIETRHLSEREKRNKEKKPETNSSRTPNEKTECPSLVCLRDADATFNNYLNFLMSRSLNESYLVVI